MFKITSTGWLPSLHKYESISHSQAEVTEEQALIQNTDSMDSEEGFSQPVYHVFSNSITSIIICFNHDLVPINLCTLHVTEKAFRLYSYIHSNSRYKEMGNEVKQGNEEIRKWRKARGSTQATWQGN